METSFSVNRSGQCYLGPASHSKNILGSRVFNAWGLLAYFTGRRISKGVQNPIALGPTPLLFAFNPPESPLATFCVARIEGAHEFGPVYLNFGLLQEPA